MKMKTFAMLAASGLMAASIAYVLPAFAEDGVNDIDGSAPMQLAMGDDAPADNNASDGNSPAASDGSSGGGANSMDNSSGSAPAAAPSAANTGATSDQPAQGDDDY